MGNMSALESPFLAQLTSGYSTGLIQRFLARINSTAQYRKTTAGEFPEACDQMDDSFYVEYFNETDRQHGSPTAWEIETCMPANLRYPTAGYFELPIYMNGQIAGPLLDKDPNNICGSSCETQDFRIT